MPVDHWFETLGGMELFRKAYRLQVETLDRFYALARRLSPDSCVVSPPETSRGQLRRNFFSTLFLTITSALCPESENLRLFGMANQGMRACVTGCDNLLDDEYKEIFDFQMAGDGPRMRSVLTIMLAERVVNAYVLEEYRDPQLAVDVGRLTYAALVPSALQECEEEIRPVPIMSPEAVLDDIHRRKTADLFLAPLALPEWMEKPPLEALAAARQALACFGLACQILDDIKDVASDASQGRHNYLISLIASGRENRSGWIEALRRDDDGIWSSVEAFPLEREQALERSHLLFEDSFNGFERLGILLSRRQRDAIESGIGDILGVPQAGCGDPGSSPPCETPSGGAVRV